MQKVLLMAALLLSVVVGVVAVPVLSRHLPAPDMAAVSVLLLLVALLGAFDVLRPSLTRSFVRNCESGPIPVRGILASTLRLGLLMATLLFGCGAFFFQRYFSLIQLLMLWAGCLAFFLCIVFWAVLDSCNKVGLAQFARAATTSVLYIACAGGAVLGRGLEFFCAVFLAVQFGLLLTLSGLAWPLFVWRGGNDTLNRSELWSTLQVNLARLFIDFSDRLLFSRVSSADFFSAYALIYDVAAKVNILPQYLNSLLYPGLCAAYLNDAGNFPARQRRLLRLAQINFGMLMAAALLLAPAADWLVLLYLGPSYPSQGYLLQIMLAVTALFSLAFYGQSWLRAEGRFADLALAYNCAMGFGVVLGCVGWAVAGVHGLVIAVLALKSPGAGIVAHLITGLHGRRRARLWLAGVAVLCALVVMLALPGPLMLFAGLCVLLPGAVTMSILNARAQEAS